MTRLVDTRNMFDSDDEVKNQEVSQNGVSGRTYRQGYSEAECACCGANSLHALRIGYSFVEWVCDICGTSIEQTLAPIAKAR
ncbi:MAG: hypothetical protein HQ475_02415 [SAR202 cluster bacterium]|nr:hypothetical protein [SAR202 cluster bacterium]